MYSPSEEVELLRDLIRFDTSNPPGGERACIEFVGSLLGQAGVQHRYLALEEERPNLVARVPGRGAAPPLLLYGHVDVVPADPVEWTHPPFAAELIDGEVWGRGALDMKGGVAMLVSALLRTASAETPPPGDVLLALTSDEEAGSQPGMRFIVEEHPGVFDGVRHALSEFGGYTLWRGGRRLVPIQVTEKQRCLIRATVRGTGGHASTVVRDPASANLGRLLSRLASHALPVHVTPAARLMLEPMASALPLHERLFIRGVLARG
ncbi:MAG: M20/M25/M40 family metallo-hydrolase, partial [Gaiellaceae bacterium]